MAEAGRRKNGKLGKEGAVFFFYDGSMQRKILTQTGVIACKLSADFAPRNVAYV